MFKPKFQMLLQRQGFPPGECICLGSQLIIIVNLLKPLLKSHFWLVADASGYGKVFWDHASNSFALKNIDDDTALIGTCYEVTQFLSGAFFAVDCSRSQQKFSQLKVGTEDEQFRCLDLQGVLVEFRAFDTAYFDCYSEDESTLRGLAQGLDKEIPIRCSDK